MPCDGPSRPISTKWRERENEAQGEIGGAYRKSVGQKVGEHLEGASAPRFVTPLDRHWESATFVAKAIFYLRRQEAMMCRVVPSQWPRHAKDRWEGFTNTHARQLPTTNNG